MAAVLFVARAPNRDVDAGAAAKEPCPHRKAIEGPLPGLLGAWMHGRQRWEGAGPPRRQTTCLRPEGYCVIALWRPEGATTRRQARLCPTAASIGGVSSPTVPGTSAQITKRTAARWLAVWLCSACSGCSGVQSALDPGGEEARQVAHLFWVMTIAGSLIWLGGRRSSRPRDA